MDCKMMFVVKWVHADHSQTDDQFFQQMAGGQMRINPELRIPLAALMMALANEAHSVIGRGVLGATQMERARERAQIAAAKADIKMIYRLYERMSRRFDNELIRACWESACDMYGARSETGGLQQSEQHPTIEPKGE